jgi:hypothetical protein
MIKSLVNKVLYKIGLYRPIPLPSVRKDVDGPYVYCHDMPRNQAASIVLDDDEFDIADGFSFFGCIGRFIMIIPTFFVPNETRP